MTVHAASYDQDPMSVRLIHAITATNKHPVSETAKRYIEARHDLTTHASGLPAGLKGLDNVDEIPGKGVSANYFGFPVMAGSPALTNTANHPLVQEYLGNGLTILTISLGKQLIAIFGMRDRPRDGVHDLIAHLGCAGKQVTLVSGDNLPAVQNFAREVGIPLDSTYAAQTPVSKGETVQSLKNLHHPDPVAFVGDGINDTIALSKADISIATGSASNASSQIIILSSDISKAMREILWTSLITRNHVLASLGFCGVYFAVAIVLASGVTEWRIPPAYAGLGELVSVMPVLLVGGHLAVVKAVKRRRSVNKVQNQHL
jgi:Cu2+-exporting ATPase